MTAELKLPNPRAITTLTSHDGGATPPPPPARRATKVRMPGRAPPAHRSQLARSLGLRTLLTGHTALFHALSPHSGSLTRHCPTSPQNPLAENLKINHGYFTTALFLSSQLRINEPHDRRLKFRPRQATSSAELVPKSSMLSHKKIRGAGHLPAKWPKPVPALNFTTSAGFVLCHRQVDRQPQLAYRLVCLGLFIGY